MVYKFEKPMEAPLDSQIPNVCGCLKSTVTRKHQLKTIRCDTLQKVDILLPTPSSDDVLE